MDKETISLKTIFVRYLRQWKLFLIVFILSFIPAILYLTIFPTTYQFVASILLQDEKESGVGGIGMGGAAGLMKSFGIGGSSGMVNVEDEMEILTSNRLMRMVILEAGLNVSYSKPYSLYKMYKEAPLKLSVDAETMAGLQDEFRFNVAVTQGKIQVNAKTQLSGRNDNFTFSSLPATIQIEAVKFTLDFDNNGASMSPFKLNIRCSPAGWVAENICKNVEVEEISSVSNVLTINYSDHSRQRGLDLLQSLIRIYNGDIESLKRDEDRKTITFVDNRIAQILKELDEVETEIEAYKTKNDMTLLETDVTLYTETYKELIASIVQAENMMIQIDLLENFVRDPENRFKAIPPIFSVDEGEKGVIPAFNKALIERDRLLNNSNERNMIFQRANSQVELLREGIYTMIKNARISSKRALDDLKLKEKQLIAKMKSIPEKEREYVNLVRNQEIAQGIYILLLQKKEETLHSLGKQTDRARVIDPPYILKKPLGPRRLYAAISILILTLVFPVAYLFTKDLIISIKQEFRNSG